MKCVLEIFKEATDEWYMFQFNSLGLPVRGGSSSFYRE